VAREVLPENFTTLEEFWSFWDTHSTDYEDAMQPVEVEVDQPSSTVYCPVAKDLPGIVRVEARRQGVSPETPINLWLQERLCASS
jgi:hypothetical protein